ncbi:MAG: stage II sporulation protein R [Defluviitaleaceae bacterium]|nr:stage II sporulation protein R [Defluviitaleaceae bacterium]
MLSQMVRWLRKEAKVLAVSAVAGVALALLAGAWTFAYSDTAQRTIADNVLRFHVNAHSDAAHDQAIKYEVRNVVLEILGGMHTDESTLYTTRVYLVTQLADIEVAAMQVLRNAGLEHDVTAEITHRFFPTTMYGDLMFPPGMYETLSISIGDGRGMNWWCLMFPPLCYVDMTGTEHTRDVLEEVVPGQGFALLTHREDDAGTAVAVRFRVVEWWQNRRAPAAQPQNLHHANR